MKCLVLFGRKREVLRSLCFGFLCKFKEMFLSFVGIFQEGDIVLSDVKPSGLWKIVQALRGLELGWLNSKSSKDTLETFCSLARHSIDWS